MGPSALLTNAAMLLQAYLQAYLQPLFSWLQEGT